MFNWKLVETFKFLNILLIIYIYIKFLNIILPLHFIISELSLLSLWVNSTSTVGFRTPSNKWYKLDMSHQSSTCYCCLQAYTTVLLFHHYQQKVNKHFLLSSISLVSSINLIWFNYWSCCRENWASGKKV